MVELVMNNFDDDDNTHDNDNTPIMMFKDNEIQNNTLLYEGKLKHINKSKMKDKIWSLLLKNPLDQRQVGNASKFLIRRFGVEKFDYFISYLPNADIPLLRYNLSPKLLSQKVHKKFKTTNRLLSHFESRSVPRSIEYFSTSDINRRDTAAKKLRNKKSRLTIHTARSGISTANDRLILEDRPINSSEESLLLAAEEFTQRTKHKKYKLKNPRDGYKVNDLSSNDKRYHEDEKQSIIQGAFPTYLNDKELQVLDKSQRKSLLGCFSNQGQVYHNFIQK